MNRITYLETLDRLLAPLSYVERRDILYDYEEHFKESINEGLLEEEIIKTLGAPKDIAKKYLTNLRDYENGPVQNNTKPTIVKVANPQSQVAIAKKGNNWITVILLLLLVLVFTITFIIPWYIPIWAIIISIFAIGIAFVFVGFALLVTGIIAAPLSIIVLPALLVQHPVLYFTTTISLICIGGLTLILTYYITKFLCYLTYHYVKWVVKLIRGY